MTSLQASALPSCISGSFAIRLKRFGVDERPVLRAGWLNVSRAHGPAILSSSLIVPTAALNHIYLSENQAASTMEAVHLSRRGAAVQRAYIALYRVECRTRKRGIIIRSDNPYFPITLIASNLVGLLVCMNQQNDCQPFARDCTCLSGRLSIFRFLHNSITLQDNWINSEFYYACRRWLSWMSFASQHSFAVNVVFGNVIVMFLIRLLPIVNFAVWKSQLLIEKFNAINS